MMNSERKHGLDLLRAVAILFVLIHHIPRLPGQYFPQWFVAISDVGWSGVDLFFVLSGFLIASQVFNRISKDDSLKTFWIKRWFRTLPLYYSVLLVYVVLKPLLGFPFRDNPLEYIFFFQNYFSPTDFVQSWSLCIEEHFYIFFPILIYFFNFRKMRAFVWLIPLLISVASRFYLYYFTDIISADESTFAHTVRFMTHNHLDGISLGVFLAKTHPRWQKWGEGFKSLLGAIGFGLVFFALYQSGMYMRGQIFIYAFTLSSIGYALILISIHDKKINQNFYYPIEKIALWSYGAYIWNHLIIRNFYHLKLNIPWYASSAIFLIISFGLAAVTFYMIERPALNLRDRFLLKRNS